jgi:hypothetical protein
MQEFKDSISIFGKTVYRVGLSDSCGELEVTGSAAYFEQSDCQMRAQGELNERLVIVKTKLSQNSKTIEEAQDFRWSHSNGIASHFDLNLAQKNALNELIERDLLLKSWAGQLQVSLVGSADLSDIVFLNDSYDIHAYNLKNCLCLLVGWPKNEALPFLMSHAVHQDFNVAVIKAKKELIQRLAFLWEEALPQDDLTTMANPEFHLNWSLLTRNQKEISSWLNQQAFSQTSLDWGAIKAQTAFCVLQESADNKPWVVEAQNSNLWKLHFGNWPAFMKHELRAPGRDIHPFA